MPPALIDKPHGWLRRWFRKVWDVRGGGLYACGFAIAFLIFEIRSLGEDFASLGQAFDGGFVRFVIGILVDSLTNTLAALVWPVYVVKTAPPWGVVGLVVAYFVFPDHVKPRLERWLSGDETVAPDTKTEPRNRH